MFCLGMLGLHLFFFGVLFGGFGFVPEVKFWSTLSNNTYGGAIFSYVGAISAGRLNGEVQKILFSFHH